MPATPWALSPDRCFSADPAQRTIARQLYATVQGLPIVSPHGHVPPALLADPAARLGTPTELLIIPDHYIFRMLYSQGVALEDLGIPSRDGTPVEADHRKIWQRFAEHFYLFRGTPTGLWLADALVNLFGVTERLNADSAQRIYDHLEAQLAREEFRPRALFGRFKQLLATTDAATDSLEHHRRLHADGLPSAIPTFRPDALVNLEQPAWRGQIEALSKVGHRRGRLRQLHPRARAAARSGRSARWPPDHATLTPYTGAWATLPPTRSSSARWPARPATTTRPSSAGIC
ncbi:MAG: glucuronate isomerase [Kouleothrix sp.]